MEDLHQRAESIVYLIKVGDVALVGTALDLEIVLNDLGQLLRRGRRLVPECDVGACLCQGSSHFVTNSPRAAGDDGDFSSHVKHLEDAVLQRRIGSTNGGHDAFLGEKVNWDSFENKGAMSCIEYEMEDVLSFFHIRT